MVHLKLEVYLINDEAISLYKCVKMLLTEYAHDITFDCNVRRDIIQYNKQ